MKVVFALEHYHPYLGGAEKLFKQLAEELATRGHEVIVVTTKFKHNLPSKELYNGVQIKRVNCRNRFFFTILSLPHLFMSCRDTDFIHATTYNAALPAWVVGFFCRKKTILTFHEVWGSLWFELPFLNTLQRWTFYFVERLILLLPFYRYIAVSKATEQRLKDKGIPSEKILQISNGLKYDRFQPYHFVEPKQFNVLYFGRLGISKGLDLLIPAWGAFSQKHPEALLKLIVPLKPSAVFKTVQALLNQHCNSANVKLLHDLDENELFEKISTASAVVIPSYSEGFCFAAAETVAIGTPIISSGKQALKEVVSGHYLEMHDQSVQGLVYALEQAYKKKWLYRPPQFYKLQRSIEAYLSLCYKY